MCSVSVDRDSCVQMPGSVPHRRVLSGICRCIFAELVDGKTPLPGHDEIQQLKRIFDLCGSPTAENWPGHEKLPHWDKLKPPAVQPRRIQDRYRCFPKEALDLVDKMLIMDPSKRITAAEALDHDYFWSEPMPCSPDMLPSFGIESAHEYETKKRRADARAAATQAAQVQAAQPGGGGAGGRQQQPGFGAGGGRPGWQGDAKRHQPAHPSSGAGGRR